MRAFGLKIGILICAFISSHAWAQVPNCTADQKAEALAAPTATSTTVSLTCNLTLSATQKITKLVQIVGSGVSGLTLDCGGGTIGVPGFNGDSLLIRSRKSTTTPATWSRPENITVKNCTVYGGIRVYGMGKNGDAEDVRLSSLSLGHTARAQAAAPKNIMLNNIDFIAKDRTPLYFAPGVTYSSLSNSTFSGTSVSTAIYLDAESAYNTIYNNQFLSFSGPREIIAVDGSANNLIHRNIFSDSSGGGIYLYRNCGEAGVIRHQPPQNNVIINNVFFGAPSIPGSGPSFSNPAIWVASRNGDKPYCNDDSGYAFGSSINNNDLAKYTVIAQNVSYNYTYSTPYYLDDSPNYIFVNTMSTASGAPTTISRESGCYKADGAPSAFVLDGQSWTQVFVNGIAKSDGYIYNCNNAVVRAERILPPPTITSFKASASKIVIGQSVTLSWDTTDAVSILLDPGAQNVTSITTNSKVVKPSVTTTYKLTAINSKGTVTKSITVTVDPIGECVPQDTIRGGAQVSSITLTACQKVCTDFFNSAQPAAYIWECRFIYPNQSEVVLTPAREPLTAP